MILFFLLYKKKPFRNPSPPFLPILLYFFFFFSIDYYYFHHRPSFLPLPPPPQKIHWWSMISLSRKIFVQCSLFIFISSYFFPPIFTQFSPSYTHWHQPTTSPILHYLLSQFFFLLSFFFPLCISICSFIVFFWMWLPWTVTLCKVTMLHWHA